MLEAQYSRLPREIFIRQISNNQVVDLRSVFSRWPKYIKEYSDIELAWKKIDSCQTYIYNKIVLVTGLSIDTSVIRLLVGYGARLVLVLTNSKRNTMILRKELTENSVLSTLESFSLNINTRLRLKQIYDYIYCKEKSNLKIKNHEYSTKKSKFFNNNMTFANSDTSSTHIMDLEDYAEVDSSDMTSLSISDHGDYDRCDVKLAICKNPDQTKLPKHTYLNMDPEITHQLYNQERVSVEELKLRVRVLEIPDTLKKDWKQTFLSEVLGPPGKPLKGNLASFVKAQKISSFFASLAICDFRSGLEDTNQRLLTMATYDSSIFPLLMIHDRMILEI